MLLIDDKEIKARDIQQGKIVKTQPQLVYSICTQTRCPILINGLNLMTWNIDRWLDHAKSKGISWYDNKY